MLGGGVVLLAHKVSFPNEFPMSYRLLVSDFVLKKELKYAHVLALGDHQAARVEYESWL